uniref:HnRNP M nuclear localisation signal domain-containing protein n=1 Tax=Callorhinchus milii TaxID=7868 RepID=A0A4W3I0W0_CALMI
IQMQEYYQLELAATYMKCFDSALRDTHDKVDKLKEKISKRGGSRFEPYPTIKNTRYRVFVSNIPFEMKWQTLKDLMREKGKIRHDLFDCCCWVL